MKKILLVFIVIILFFTFIIYRNSDPGLIISHLDKKDEINKLGDLRYRIYFMGILPVGEAVLETEQIDEYQGEKVYHLSGSANVLNFFSKFFNGYAVIDSYIDMRQFNPIVFRERFKFPNRVAVNKEVFYEQGQGIMSIAGVSRQMLPNTQDPLSAMFNIRRIDFSKTKDFEMNINTNQKNYILKGRAQLEDTSTNNKIYKTIFLDIKIKRRNDNSYHKSSITTILLRDRVSTPLLIKFFANGILINARLIDIR